MATVPVLRTLLAKQEASGLTPLCLWVFGLKGLAGFPHRPSWSIAGGSLAADSGPGNGCSCNI